MDKNDKGVLAIYMEGFYNKLFETGVTNTYTGINRVAWDLGRDDAALGDDLSDADLESDERVMERIQNTFNKIKS